MKNDPKKELLEKAARTFEQRFGAPPEVVSFAPGRVEILGNHTDYNGGYVLSVALDLGIAAAGATTGGDSQEVEMFSEELQLGARFSLQDTSRNSEAAWGNYVKGVLLTLSNAGAPVRGMRLAFVSDLPIGSGVSSSAALEIATAESAYALFGGRPPTRMQEAILCQRAEVEFVGMPCGLLDQFSSLFGKRDHLLFLDCLTRENEAIPFGRSDIQVLVSDTGVRRELVSGQYASLRKSCERAAARLGEILGKEIRFLREVGLDDFLPVAGRVNLPDRDRAEHVIRENERVLQGRDALRHGDVEKLGRLMVDSHESSRDLFGNSCAELDLLVDEAQSLPGSIGAKLCGGGFGGSTVSLVESNRARDFIEVLSERYRTLTGRPPRILSTRIGDGARLHRL